MPCLCATIQLSVHLYRFRCIEWLHDGFFRVKVLTHLSDNVLVPHGVKNSIELQEYTNDPVNCDNVYNSSVYFVSEPEEITNIDEIIDFKFHAPFSPSFLANSAIFIEFELVKVDGGKEESVASYILRLSDYASGLSEYVPVTFERTFKTGVLHVIVHSYVVGVELRELRYEKYTKSNIYKYWRSHMKSKHKLDEWYEGIDISKYDKKYTPEWGVNNHDLILEKVNEILLGMRDINYIKEIMKILDIKINYTDSLIPLGNIDTKYLESLKNVGIKLLKWLCNQIIIQNYKKLCKLSGTEYIHYSCPLNVVRNDYKNESNDTLDNILTYFDSINKSPNYEDKTHGNLKKEMGKNVRILLNNDTNIGKNLIDEDLTQNINNLWNDFINKQKDLPTHEIYSKNYWHDKGEHYKYYMEPVCFT